MDALIKTAGGRQLPSEPLDVEYDLFVLGRCYRTLSINAMKATSPGGTLRSASRTSLREPVSRSTIPALVSRLTVSKKIFDSCKTMKQRGLVLGCAISSKSVEPLEGTIRAHREVGVWATFVSKLPQSDRQPFQTVVATVKQDKDSRDEPT